MIALSFLNPFLLWGAGLASIPLIIHILNRRRYKTVQWAAMEFLLKAFKENRRRIRFEQLLLLLLRMALVGLLAFLLSRPKASSDDLGAFVRSTVHHIMIVDESGSMSETAGSGNAFDTAKSHVTARVDALARERSGSDLFTLLRSSSEKPDMATRPVTLALLSDVRDLLKPLRPTPDRFDLEVALGRVQDVVKKVPQDKVDRTYIYIVSDFRAADLLGAEGKMDEGVLKALRQLDPSKVLLSLCGKTNNTNLALVGIDLKEARSIKNQVAHYEVTIENQGNRDSGEFELGFSMDGRSRKVRMIQSIAPGERHVETFRATFTEAGHHFVEADIPTDRIPIDNRRVFAFPVVDSAKVLLVDGDPGESEELAETFYLQYALDPVGNAGFGLEVTRVDDNEVSERELDMYDLVVIANVATLDDETNKRLDTYARGGGGLLMYVGDQIDVDTWNRLFWKEGKGLLPAPLFEDRAGDQDNPEKVVLTADGHPMFLETDGLGQTLSFVGIWRWFVTGSEADNVAEGAVPEETKVLMRVGHESGPPLLTERRYGKGRVALCLTTADAAWTPWAANPSYVLVTRMAVEYLMRREPLEPYNIDAKGTFRKSFSAADYQTDVRLGPAKTEDEVAITERGFTASPRPEEPDLLDLIAKPVEGRVWPAAGGYKLTLRKGGGEDEPVYFSVSPWDSEGKPEILDRRRIETLFPQEFRERLHFIEKSAAQGDMLTDEGEIWKYLAIALLAGLFLETLLAWRFGHR